MIIDSLARDILDREEFLGLYKQLLQSELQSLFDKYIYQDLFSQIHILDDDSLDTLLECGIIFATVPDDNSEAVNYHDIAYRIAILTKHHYPSYANKNESELYIIFSRLGRYPIATQYFGNRDIEIHNQLPIITYLSENLARLENTITINQTNYLLTNFQRKFWDKLHRYKQLAVCAPTSAGKSFILTQHVVQEYFTHPREFIAVYIVPTNALINEISDDIIKFSINNYNRRPTLFTTGIDFDPGVQRRAIYVLTQEKLSSLIAKGVEQEITAEDIRLNLKPVKKPFVVDLLVVDEAQIIADGERGGITKNVIEDLLENRPETKIVLGSPPIKNLGEFANFFELKELETYPETISPVAKNLIRILKLAGTNKEFDIQIDFGSTRLELLKQEIPQINTSTISKRLAGFAKMLGGTSPSLIYASKKSECLKIAEELVSSADTTKVNKKSVEEFSQFISDFIHPQFALKEFIKCGVGFHFGALPLIVTKQLEEKFRNRDFPFLVSTSTLLHGVNLPAKNLFLCRPTKGQNLQLDEIEFWNLIGRAGRLGQDFQGNVFVIEDKLETEELPLWSTSYIASAGNQKIESALDKCLKPQNTGSSILSDYLYKIISNTDISDEEKVIENVFSQLMYHHRKGRLRESLKRSAFKLDEEETNKIIGYFNIIASGLAVSAKILDQHRGISPIKINSLYLRITELANTGQMDDRIPLHPRDNLESKAYKNLETIFRTLWKQFGVGGDLKRQPAMANIAFGWMQGDNYNVLAKKYVDEVEFGSDIPTVKIYNFFDELQRTISFEYAKFMRCYIDILTLVNGETTPPFLSGHPIAPLHSYLEEGTYLPAQLSLIKNGLSRMTALEIHRVLGDDLKQNPTLEETRSTVYRKAKHLKQSLHPYFFSEASKIFDLEMAIVSSN